MLTPLGLAFDSAGNPYSTDYAAGNGDIEEFTPGGAGSLFATGLSYPVFLAIQVPEPPTWALLGLGLPALLAFRRNRQSA